MKYPNNFILGLRLNESILRTSRRARLWVRKKSRLTAHAIFCASPRQNLLIKNLSSIQDLRKKRSREQMISTTRTGIIFLFFEYLTNFLLIIRFNIFKKDDPCIALQFRKRLHFEECARSDQGQSQKTRPEIRGHPGW